MAKNKIPNEIPPEKDSEWVNPRLCENREGA